MRSCVRAYKSTMHYTSDFRFSFAYDIARGVEFLHVNKLFHGRLTSSNCVVDDRWMVKITGRYACKYKYS